MLLAEKEDKKKQNTRYRELIEEYKKINDDMSIELSVLRDSNHGNCPLKSE